MTITAPEMFQEMSPKAPLPWREHKFRKGVIVDAKGDIVCWFDGNDPEWRNTASMIIVAVNTCGGFKAEIAYDPTAQPFDEPLRYVERPVTRPHRGSAE